MINFYCHTKGFVRQQRELSGISNYTVSTDYLITSSKNSIELYQENNLKPLGKLTFDRFPKIIQTGRDSFLLQDQTKFLKVKYSLDKKELFDLNIQNLWMVHYVNEHFLFFKRAIDRLNGLFQLIKYDLKGQVIIWESNCDNYKFWVADKSHLIIDSDKSSSLQRIDIESGKCSWEVQIGLIFNELYPSDKGICEIISKPLVYEKVLIIQAQKPESGYCYLVGLDLETGNVKWHHRGYSNFELYKGKLYNIEFNGQYRVLNSETGEVEQEADLKDEFERIDINCEHRFNVTDTHIYFKYAIKGKFGILNTKTLKIEEVQQLPKGNTMSTEEYPIPVGNRLYVRSAPQNNLFIYERE